MSDLLDRRYALKVSLKALLRHHSRSIEALQELAVPLEILVKMVQRNFLRSELEKERTSMLALWRRVCCYCLQRSLLVQSLSSFIRVTTAKIMSGSCTRVVIIQIAFYITSVFVVPLNLCLCPRHAVFHTLQHSRWGVIQGFLLQHFSSFLIESAAILQTSCLLIIHESRVQVSICVH